MSRAQRQRQRELRRAVVSAEARAQALWESLMGVCPICGGPECADVDSGEMHCDRCGWVCSGLSTCECSMCQVVARVGARLEEQERAEMAAFVGPEGAARLAELRL